MIAMLKGIIWGIDQEKIILNVNGVGYQLFLPSGSLREVNEGDEKTFYTYLAVREDDISLYGFNRLEEKKLFISLLRITGIGPKVALSILSTLSSGQIKQAILSEDISLLTKIPGIGGKTAKRLILELKEKISSEEFIDENAEDMQFPSSIKNEAVETLLSLGFSRQEARSALSKVSSNKQLSVEEQIKEALRIIAKEK